MLKTCITPLLVICSLHVPKIVEFYPCIQMLSSKRSVGLTLAGPPCNHTTVMLGAASDDDDVASGWRHRRIPHQHQRPRSTLMSLGINEFDLFTYARLLRASSLHYVRGSAVAERPRDALCQWKSCQLLYNCRKNLISRSFNYKRR